MEESRARNFREYTVWQDSISYATYIYKTTEQIPWFERKGICDQLRRAVVSISSNIAEGAARPTDKDFAHFLDTALGSAYEVETQLLISKNVGYIEESQYQELQSRNIKIQKQLIALIRKIRHQSKS